MQDDINQLKRYSVFIGTKRTIEITKEAFQYAGVEENPNIIFYEVISKKSTENKLLLVTDNLIKFKILKELHIL
jgi:hypothetical protein